MYIHNPEKTPENASVGDIFYSNDDFLVFDGTSWVPTQHGQDGQILLFDGEELEWVVNPYQKECEPPFSHLEAWERGKSVLED